MSMGSTFLKRNIGSHGGRGVGVGERIEKRGQRGNCDWDVKLRVPKSRSGAVEHCPYPGHL